MLTIRISFEKRAEAAFISLLDLQRIFQRILKRSGLPVYYTQGFNPHIYLSFACPLSLGQESLCESCEVKTADEAPDLEAWRRTLQPYMPHGITITKIAQARQKVTEIAWADYAVTVPAVAAPALAEYAAAEQVIVAKKTKRGRKEIDIKAFLPAIETAPAGEDALLLKVKLPCAAGEGDNLNPSLLLGWLEQKADIHPWQCEVLREHLYTKSGEEFC